ncbi:MAG TPA: hypothetical protein VF531_08205 [Bacillota bacterium]
MGAGLGNLQQWLIKNRLPLWWGVFLPCMMVLLFFGRELFRIPAPILENTWISFQSKVLNTIPLIILARIVVAAAGIVALMICFLFPILRVSKEGVQWTKEFGEELANVSGEITGEEIAHLVVKETLRWSLIYGWLRLREQGESDPHLLLREFLGTIWETFPECRLSLTWIDGDAQWTVLHPLLSRLVREEAVSLVSDEHSFGVRLELEGGNGLVLRIYANDAAGFSQVDERFLTVLGEAFLQEVVRGGFSGAELLTYFQKTSFDFIPHETPKDTGGEPG